MSIAFPKIPSSILFFVGYIFLLTGCTDNLIRDQLSGVSVTNGTRFLWRDVFVEGDDLYVGVDPSIYETKSGETYSIFVVPHQSQWVNGTTLQDVTGSVESGTVSPLSLWSNQVIWSNMTLPPGTHQWHGHYDIVIDFDGNGQYDEGVDVVDNIGIREIIGAEESGGITLVKDPVTMGDFQIGRFSYDLGDFTITAPAPPDFWDVGGPITISIRGELYYPANFLSGGNDYRAPLSTDWNQYPFVVVAHGYQGDGIPDNHLGFKYFTELLASRGFIVATIDLSQFTTGWRVHHRGMVILEHIERFLNKPLPPRPPAESNKPGESIQDTWVQDIRPKINRERIGLIGHSRGGEAVVAAQQIHADLNISSYALGAAVSLAPTDGSIQYAASKGRGPYDPAVPYLMIYGTHDSDCYWGEGYRLVDRAKRPKYAVTLYGANHTHFNERWHQGQHSCPISWQEQGGDQDRFQSDGQRRADL